MTESIQPPEPRHADEALHPQEIIDLHHETLEVVTTLVSALPMDAALREQGTMGEVKFFISFPSESENPPPNVVAVVDYGEGVERHPVPYIVVNGEPQIGAGFVNERYGLRTWNYTPKGLLVSHVPLRPGVPLVLGTEDTNSYNFNLGLAGSAAVNNMLISPKHVTLALRQGMFSITDRSRYGTQMIVAPQPLSTPFWRTPMT